MRKRLPLTRRTFLRGAGAVIALPMLEAMAPIGRARASAAALPYPNRSCFWTFPGGSILEHWKPEHTGPLADKLPSLLRPLEFAREDLLVLSGLSNHTDARDGSDSINTAHAIPNYHFLTGSGEIFSKNRKVTASISVDQKLAKLMGRETILDCLLLASKNSSKGRFSWSSPETQVPYEFHPRLAFDRMFAGRTPRIPDWQARASGTQPSAEGLYSREGSVLDAVIAQTHDLERRLGKSDKDHLDSYLTSVRALEQRVERLDAMGAVVAKENAGRRRDPRENPFAEHEGLPTPEFPAAHGYEIGGFEQYEEHLRMMADLMVLGFQTDATRVGVMAHGSDADWANVVSLGNEFHHHTLQHNGNGRRTDPIAREALREVNFWFMRQFAYFVKRLQETPEGEGRLIDHCMVFCGSELADGGHYRHDLPVLLVGHGNGTITPGRHLRYQDKTPLTNLWVEMLNAMGVETQEFGDSLTNQYAAYYGRLPGLKAS